MRKIDAHGDQVCALLSDGAVRCIQAGEPLDIPGLADAVDLAVGRGFGCAATQGGKAYCWGYNPHDVLGMPSVGAGAAGQYRRAEPVPGVEGAIAVAAADAHACALLADGTAWCWGNNHSGQLGRADRADAMPPSPLPGLRDAVELALTSSGTCARTRADTVVCTRGTPGAFEELIPLRGARRLSAGMDNLCAIVGDDALRCWMGEENGDVMEFTGRTIEGLPKASRVSLDEVDAHGCAITPEGQVRCWGHNLAGELGACTPREGDAYESKSPLVVEGLHGAVEVVAARDRSCALLSDGTVRCWGDNSSGELGNGLRWSDRIAAALPTVFDAPSPPACVSARMYYDGDVKGLSWGQTTLTSRVVSPGGENVTCVETDLAAGTAKVVACPAKLGATGQPQAAWTASDGAKIVYDAPGTLSAELVRTGPGEKKASAKLRLLRKVGLVGELRGEELVLAGVSSSRPSLSKRSEKLEVRPGDVLVLDARTLRVKKHIQPPLCVKAAPIPAACP